MAASAVRRIAAAGGGRRAARWRQRNISSEVQYTTSVRVLTDQSQMARSRDPFHHSARPVPSRRRPYTSLDDTIVCRAYLTASAEGPTN